jgi:hypothetical protein
MALYPQATREDLLAKKREIAFHISSLERKAKAIDEILDLFPMSDKGEHSEVKSGQIIEAENALEVQEGTRVQDCADRSGPYSNPID